MAVGNSGSRMVGNTEFYGGLSTDSKIGIENSYADGECLDVRKSPGQMTVLPMSRKFSDSGVITGLMTAMTQSKDGNIWGIDENGKVYKIDENNAITAVSTSASSSGFGLECFNLDDGLWFADNGHKLYSYGPVINPTGADRATYGTEFVYDDGKFINYYIAPIVSSDSITWEVNTSKLRHNGTASCEVQTEIVDTIVAENTGERKYAIAFLPANVSVDKIGVYFTQIAGKGTVKLVIHNENDEVVASSEEIEVDSTGYTEFTVRPNPSSPLSASNQLSNYNPWSGGTVDAGSIMHIHVVATSAGNYVRTTDEGNMFWSADITSQSTVLLETYNKKHPMASFIDLYIGNGRYVSTKSSSPLSYVEGFLTQNVLRLDDGYEVCSFASSDEYLMIGAEKYSAGSKRGFQMGRIYFWDRVSEEASFYIDCKMGSPKCMYNFGEIVYVVVAGALYAYTGGKELVKVRTLDGTDTEYTGRSDVTEVYPNMMAIRREILLLGFPSKTTAYKIRHGIYAFGSIDKNYPNCFTYNYRVPGESADITLDQHNSDTQSLRIGCVYNFGDTLFYSYEVGTKNGSEWTYTPALALIDNESGTSTTFMWKSLQYDAGSPAYQKYACRVGIYFDALPANTTITPIYRIDDGEWITGPGTAVAGDRYITCEINERFHELQYGFVGTTGNDTLTPAIKQVAAEVRVLNEEAKL